MLHPHTMPTRHSILLLWAAIAICSAQLIEANTLFRFALQFHVKSADDGISAEGSTAMDAFNSSITVRNNEISIRDNSVTLSSDENSSTSRTTTATVGPLDAAALLWWERQESLNTAADDKLQASRKAISGLLLELSPLVGRSDDIAAVVNLAIRYTNEASAAGVKKFEILRKFTNLVERLQALAADGASDERSLERKLVQLALEKYRVVALGDEVRTEVLQAEQAWQLYVRQKLIEVAA